MNGKLSSLVHVIPSCIHINWAFKFWYALSCCVNMHGSPQRSCIHTVFSQDNCIYFVLTRQTQEINLSSQKKTKKKTMRKKVCMHDCFGILELWNEQRYAKFVHWGQEDEWTLPETTAVCSAKEWCPCWTFQAKGRLFVCNPFLLLRNNWAVTLNWPWNRLSSLVRAGCEISVIQLWCKGASYWLHWQKPCSHPRFTSVLCRCCCCSFNIFLCFSITFTGCRSWISDCSHRHHLLHTPLILIQGQ